MQRFHHALIAIVLIAFASSCKKNSDSGNNPGGQNGAKLVRIQQGIDPLDDSVYLIRYDGTGRTSVVIDSINNDTLTGVYNGGSQLTNIAESNAYYHDALNATYNSTGQLTEMTFSFFGENDKYVFTYTAGSSMPSQCAYYTNSGSGSLFLYRTYVYTVTGQNITGVKEYDKSNTFLGEHKMTFGTQANPFKTISLFNWGNRLGMNDIVMTESIFNANLHTSTTWYGDSNNIIYTTTVTATNDQSGNPTKITASEKYPDGSIQSLFTWGLSFK